MRTTLKLTGLALVGVLALGACATDPAVRAQKAAEAQTRKNAALINAALLDGGRPDEDRANDAARMPAEVLKFSGISEGYTVLEVEAGGGYYTELMSFVVGETGRVYMQNPAAFNSFSGDEIEARVADNRLPNVVRLTSQFDDFSAIPTGSIDLVTWILGPHELYFKNFNDVKLDLGDPQKSYAEIYRVLKPSGKFLAVDHNATTGAPESVGDTLHRIDPGLVQIEAEKAGLKLVGESKALENSTDDLSKNVFDPAVRRKTSRFILKFEKEA